MKYKHLLIILLTLSLLISPAFAFWHPPPPPTVPCPDGTFAVKIRDQWCYDPSNPFEFTEPEDNFCDDVKVTVLAYNVTDLYGYEFTLWWNPTYFALKSWKIEKVWDPQFIVYNATADAWFKAAVVAERPAVGVTKPEVLLVTLTFHIVNDVCWPQGPVSGVFMLKDIKASDSCTGKIDLCGPLHGYWVFIPKEPEVYIEPKKQINCVVGEKVTYSVWVYNITKMKSLHFDLRWSGNHIVNYEDLWLPILNITKKDVVINEAVFPKANRTSSITVENIGGLNQTFRVVVDIVMACTFPLINGTFKAVDLTFTKKDPWYCGRQPNYTRIDHVWTPDNATTDLWFEKGWIDVMCPTLKYICFGDFYKDVTCPYTFTGQTTVSTSWPANPYVTGLHFNVKVWCYAPTDLMVFEAEWLENKIPNPSHIETAGMMFDVDGNGWADFEVIFSPLGNWYQIFDGVNWVAKPMPAYIYTFGPDWAIKGHFWVYMEIPRAVLTPEPCCEWYKWGIEARDTNEIGLLAVPPTPGQWLINWPFCDYNIGQNWYADANHPLGSSYYLAWLKTPACSVASYNKAKFVFMPVPGDLTGDGKVDITDLLILAGKYGKTWTWPFPGTWAEFRAIYYYDFNKDKVIDIFDIIVLTKNFGKECPY